MCEEVKNYLPFSEKYLPSSFKDLVHSRKTNKILEFLSGNFEEELPNILLYGTAGSGKYSRLFVTLKHFFDQDILPNVKAIDVDTGYFTELPCAKSVGNKKVLFSLVSKVHCEIEVSQAHIDKALILFLENYCKTKNVNLNVKKHIILRNIEFLKRETQNSLRKLIEKHKSRAIFFVTTRSLSRVIIPLRSRFLILPVKSPGKEHVFEIVKEISHKENFSVTEPKLNKIIRKSLYGPSGTINLNKFMVTLEGSLIISGKSKILKVYETETNELLSFLIKSVKKKNHREIRNILYKIYESTKDNFKEIVFGDFYREMLKEVKDKKTFSILTSEWDSKMNSIFVEQCLFQAEAYLFSICEL